MAGYLKGYATGYASAAGTTVTPSLVSGSGAVQTATITASATVSATTVTGSGTVQTPSLVIPGVPSPATVTGSGAVQTVTVTATGSSSPTTGAGSGGVQTPSGAVVTFPATVGVDSYTDVYGDIYGASGVVPSPTISLVNATIVTPAVITGSGSVQATIPTVKVMATLVSGLGTVQVPTIQLAVTNVRGFGRSTQTRAYGGYAGQTLAGAGTGGTS